MKLHLALLTCLLLSSFYSVTQANTTITNVSPEKLRDFFEPLSGFRDFGNCKHYVNFQAKTLQFENSRGTLANFRIWLPIFDEAGNFHKKLNSVTMSKDKKRIKLIYISKVQSIPLIKPIGVDEKHEIYNENIYQLTKDAKEKIAKITFVDKIFKKVGNELMTSLTITCEPVK